jgi:23S rRNA maturation-related 3'-5' exoribonuclease YhaM
MGNPLFDEFVQQINRPGINNLIEALPGLGYFDAPSSGGYHGAKPGGNLTHSLNVTEMAMSLYESHPYFMSLEPESIIICGLFHDIGKCNWHGKPQYVTNVLLSGSSSKNKPYKTNPDRLPVPHQTASVLILNQYISLTEDEEYAILYHNGLYTPDGNVIKGNETQLLTLLHFCDMWCSRFIERDDDNG